MEPTRVDSGERMVEREREPTERLVVAILNVENIHPIRSASKPRQLLTES